MPAKSIVRFMFWLPIFYFENHLRSDVKTEYISKKQNLAAQTQSGFSIFAAVNF